MAAWVGKHTPAGFKANEGIVFVIAHPADMEQALDLPPGYTLVALRELRDAFAHACEIAAEAGAGTLVWVRRYDLVEFAVVLEPDEPLRSARRALFAGMNAVADAIAAHCPPEREVAFDWPDAIRFDAGLLGGGRLGWPAECIEDDIPEWLVFGVILRAGASSAQQAVQAAVAARPRKPSPAPAKRSRTKVATVPAPSPTFRLVNTKGRSPRMRLASRSITSSEAPTMGARSILLITSRSDLVMPGPPLRGILSPAATSIT